MERHGPGGQHYGSGGDSHDKEVGIWVSNA